jgi:hypothetical protein
MQPHLPVPRPSIVFLQETPKRLGRPLQSVVTMNEGAGTESEHIKVLLQIRIYFFSSHCL